jgi:hypothetical protein
MVTQKVRLDRIASSTRNAKLGKEVLVTPQITCGEGYVLAVRILTEKTVYNRVEDPVGRLIELRRGDVLAGVLGRRRALRGYAGEVPTDLGIGDTVNVLNLGGVLGHCTAQNPDLGPPIDAEVLGAVLSFPKTGDRIGRPANIAEGAIPSSTQLDGSTPIVAVAGTCMDAGKTVAASEIVRGLTRAGLKVCGTKLTGVALRRDVLAMIDSGATAALTFNDAGIVSTDETGALTTAYGLINELEKNYGPDVIVAELGDGILGEYGVASLLEDDALKSRFGALVCCAPDQVAAWGAVKVLEERFGLRPTVISGPTTDNEVGCRFVKENLKLPAFNARRQPEDLSSEVMGAIGVSAAM